MALTGKRAIFVREYLRDLDGRAAAVRSGYSEKTAAEQSYQLLQRADVAETVNAALAKRAEKTEIETERVLAEIAAMAFYDVADLIVDGEAEGNEPAEIILDGRVIHGLRSLADICRLPEKLRRVIVGWGWDRSSNFTVKLADKSRALDQLCRHLGLYNDKLAVSGLEDLAARLARAKTRATGGS